MFPNIRKLGNYKMSLADLRRQKKNKQLDQKLCFLALQENKNNALDF